MYVIIKKLLLYGNELFFCLSVHFGSFKFFIYCLAFLEFPIVCVMRIWLNFTEILFLSSIQQFKWNNSQINLIIIKIIAFSTLYFFIQVISERVRSRKNIYFHLSIFFLLQCQRVAVLLAFSKYFEAQSVNFNDFKHDLHASTATVTSFGIDKLLHTLMCAIYKYYLFCDQDLKWIEN